MTAINPYEPPQEVSQSVGQPATLPVRAAGILTAEDAIRGLRALGKWRPSLLPAVALASLAAATIFMIVFQGFTNITLVLATLAVVMLLFLWISFGAKERLQKQLNSSPEHREPKLWTFSDEGLYIETAFSKHFHAWNAFKSASITPDFVILAQQGENLWNVIPRRFIATQSEWLAVSQLLAAKLPVHQIGG